MTPAEFIARAVGLPWVRWRSGWDGCDCFGLVILWHREVLGVDLGSVPQAGIAEGFVMVEGWSECEPAAGAPVFMAWRNGAPTHCGILLPDSMLLHAEGSEDHPGSVRVSRLAAVERVYGSLKFYRHATC